jgi:predicted nucleotidyltransferase
MPTLWPPVMTAISKLQVLFMTTISHNLTGKIDGDTITIISSINEIAHEMEIPFFIVGATARDILLQHAHDIHSTRATIDIDIGVFVSDWAGFHNLKNALVESGQFKPGKLTQRLFFYKDNLPVDIVPFGKIARDGETIIWPPKHEIEMSIAGFQECYQYAVSVLIREKPDLIVKVVSLAGLAILKIVSWDDNIERRGKDSADLYIVIRNYIEAGNMERFFEEGGDILKEESSDYDLSSARFLGREISKIASPATKTKLIDILRREASSLQGHKIALTLIGQDSFQNESYDRVVEFFNALLRGLLD